MAKLNFITKKRNFTPLNLGGIIFSSAMLGLLFGPGLASNDLLATTIACSFLAMLITLGLLTLLSYLTLRKNFSYKLFCHSDNLQGTIFARELVNLHGSIATLWLAPLTRAKIQILPDESNLHFASHEIIGGSKGTIILKEQIIFPHRGIWNFNVIKVQIQDTAGLWNLNFSYDFKTTTVKVEPPPREASSITVLSSVFTSGDTIPMGEQRMGDFYDLKSYHASDGVNRIAWKIFAKSGELITRQPEKEIRPDGKALIFCAAGAGDDQIASECLAYLRLLESLEIEILFNCEGSRYPQLCKSSATALEILIESGRQTTTQIMPSLTKELCDFAEQAQQIVQAESCSVVIFIGESRLHYNQAIETILSALTQLNTLNLEPIIVCRNPELIQRQTERLQKNNFLTRLLLVEDSPAQQSNQQELSNLITASSKKNWNILTCP